MTWVLILWALLGARYLYLTLGRMEKWDGPGTILLNGFLALLVGPLILSWLFAWKMLRMILRIHL